MFVDLPPLSTTPNPPTECQLEFENGHGLRLALHWKGHTAPDLALLARLVHAS